MQLAGFVILKTTDNRQRTTDIIITKNMNMNMNNIITTMEKSATMRIVLVIITIITDIATAMNTA